jgi:membrane protein DedA with SNARE-associated domain
MTDLPLTLVLGFSLAFAESGLGLGMVVPGETGVVVLAAMMPGSAALATLGLVVTAGASAGDHVGYLLGRRYGDRLRETRVVTRLGRRHYDRAADLMQRRGGAAVLLTRLVPIVRTLTPAAAGASGLPYRRFLPASIAGSAVWASAYVGGGSLVGAMSGAVQDTFGRAAWLVAVLVGLALVPVVLLRVFTGVRPAPAAPDVERFEHARDLPRGRAGSSALAGEFRADPRPDPVLVRR